MKTKSIVFILVAVVLLTFVVIVVSQKMNDTGITTKAWGERTAIASDAEERYAQAVNDAATIEESEKHSIKTVITENNEYTTWNEGKVLLVTYTRYADSYTPGQTMIVDWSDSIDAIWVFADKEMDAFYEENKSDVTDWSERFTEVLGLPVWNVGKYTHFAAFWVDPKDIIRPAYNSDITSDESVNAFAVDENWNVIADTDFKTWFDGNIVFSYFDDDYPWTRLGYTYDWNADSDEYGMSEYLVNGGAEIEVEFCYTTDEFVNYLENN